MSKYVTVSETVVLQRNTVEGLLDTIKEEFSSKEKPIRLVYTKNEPLIVDRRVREELAGQGVTVTAYQMVRQHSDIDITESIENPVRAVAKSVQRLSDKDHKLIALVTNNKVDLYSWFDDEIRPEKMLNTQLIEDPDCPENCLFICGSKSGLSIKDIEISLLCRME
jgi:hypothetical protein